MFVVFLDVTVQGIGINASYCGEAEQNGPLVGSMPLDASPLVTFSDAQLTAVAVATADEHTIAFLGTSDGHLKKVSISPRICRSVLLFFVRRSTRARVSAAGILPAGGTVRAMSERAGGRAGGQTCGRASGRVDGQVGDMNRSGRRVGHRVLVGRCAAAAMVISRRWRRPAGCCGGHCGEDARDRAGIESRSASGVRRSR